MHAEEEDPQGKAVLDALVASVREAFGPRLLAAYALGSLAHGGFSALVSDVDFGILLADPLDERYAKLIDQARERVVSSGLPLADRASIFWASVSSFNSGQGGRFIAYDRTDLLESGRLVFGKDVRDRLRRPPSTALILEGAQFALDMLEAHFHVTDLVLAPDRLMEEGTRPLTKVLLFPVRFVYTLHTGRIAPNDVAVTHFLRTETGPLARLVREGYRWRTEAPKNREKALALLRETLVPLYLRFLDVYLCFLDAYFARAKAPDNGLAAQLRGWRARLAPGSGTS